MQMRRLLILPALLLGLALSGCQSMPEGVEPVDNFDLDRYLGKWYEIARLDHRFERGLSEVTAEYSLRPDGQVKVVNSGYSASAGDREQAEGRAKFAGERDQGYLKVSFFGPFFGSYVVFELDPDYRYAFIAGNTTDYLWLLAREPVVDASVRERFIQRAGELGFNVDELIWVEHGSGQE
jgi:apolipoprotein D and lipocalin family protein